MPFKKAHWDVQHERHAEAEEKRPQDIKQPARRVRQQRQVLQGPVKEYRRTRDAQCGYWAEAEDQHRVQHDITDAARDQGSHGGLHPANGLKHLLKGKVCHIDDGEQEDDGSVEHTHRDEGFVGGEAAQEARHDGNADQGAEQTVQHRKRHAVRG